MYRQFKNILLNRGWSFAVTALTPSRRVIRPGQVISVRGTVQNNGLRAGTAYPRVRLVDTYDSNVIAFDSHENAEQAERSHARVVDLPPRASRSFDITCVLPVACRPGMYDLTCQLWPPAELYNHALKSRQFEMSHWLFDETQIQSAIEIVDDPIGRRGQMGATAFGPVSGHASVFVSYSWDNQHHAEWVLALSEELVRFGVNVMLDRWHLHPGEEVLHFMERGCRECDKLLVVCTQNYVRRANNRIGGVGFETVVTSDLYYRSTEKRRFIPVLREGSSRQESPLPSYMGSALYVDMRTDDWHGYPFKQLLRAIYEEYECLPPALGQPPGL